jgi:putative two-component system response regulator
MARQIAFHHHERWDGSGYPNGLVGEQIPLPARIVAVADVYDALSTKRVYKDAIRHEECVAMIKAAAGRHFDPDLIEAWLSIESKCRHISQHYSPDADEAEPLEGFGADFDSWMDDKQMARDEALLSAASRG